ncbi:hypothetical protein CANMA_002875 [Candida margitis]|uniref:uncharacterized protein n=1 Tax=Candida margitis TaxID=1775924 RepID=UPI002227309B|nr:uncharacterized protein CANMA_002875 [Candida margitis]KAI5967695.1 hypothetical protein CANMA_002875 [Candida margitis]
MSLKGSTTTSQLLREKATPDKKLNKKNLTNLQDIESALYDLEIEEDSQQRTRRVCNCMARKHPLFEIAPNCLNCGKIICTKEGLQPCSFCGSDLIAANDKDAIIQVLNKEKNELLRQDQRVEAPSQPKQKKKIVVKMNPGEKFWEAQDRAFKLAEQELKNRDQPTEVAHEVNAEQHTSTNSDQDLDSARARLETLLNFQDTGAERTRIIDNASDFEMPTQSIWLSPEERALNLKMKQRLARDEKREKVRQKRGEKQLEMVIKNGKVVMVEKYTPVKEEVTEDEQQLMNEIKKSKTAQEKNNSVWDYDQDKIKWGKPVYFSNSNQTDPEQEFKGEPKPRVQFESSKDTSELIATMI